MTENKKESPEENPFKPPTTENTKPKPPIWAKLLLILLVVIPLAFLAAIISVIAVCTVFH